MLTVFPGDPSQIPLVAERGEDCDAEQHKACKFESALHVGYAVAVTVAEKVKAVLEPKPRAETEP